MLIVISTEDFGESHKAIVKQTAGTSMNVSRVTKKPRPTVTEAAADGDLSEQEKSELRLLIKNGEVLEDSKKLLDCGGEERSPLDLVVRALEASFMKQLVELL